MRMRFAAICALLLCAIAVTARTANQRSGGNQNTDVPRGVYPTGAASTPTATPCGSVGSWTEQDTYFVAVSGNAVASQGGDLYSFVGIFNTATPTVTATPTPRLTPTPRPRPSPAPRPTV